METSNIENKKICVVCENNILNTETKPDIDGNYYCSNCISNKYISNYHTHPARNLLIFNQDIEEQNNPFKLFLGIELEVANGKQHIPKKAQKIISGFSKNLVFIEYDSSLSALGFEMVFHPTTIKALKNNEENIKKLFSIVKYYGFRSHDTSCCGLHIHVDTTYISEYTVLLLYEFMKKYETLLRLFGRRKYNTYCETVNFKPLKSKLIDDMKILSDVKYTQKISKKYLALARKKQTLEFRFMKGTLNINSFYGSVQFIHNLVELCIIKQKIPTFLDVIKHNNFPELHKYVEESKYIQLEKPKINDKDNITDKLSALENFDDTVYPILCLIHDDIINIINYSNNSLLCKKSVLPFSANRKILGICNTLLIFSIKETDKNPTVFLYNLKTKKIKAEIRNVEAINIENDSIFTCITDNKFITYKWHNRFIILPLHKCLKATKNQKVKYKICCLYKNDYLVTKIITNKNKPYCVTRLLTSRKKWTEIQRKIFIFDKNASNLVKEFFRHPFEACNAQEMQNISLPRYYFIANDNNNNNNKITAVEYYKADGHFINIRELDINLSTEKILCFIKNFVYIKAKQIDILTLLITCVSDEFTFSIELQGCLYSYIVLDTDTILIVSKHNTTYIAHTIKIDFTNLTFNIYRKTEYTEELAIKELVFIPFTDVDNSFNIGGNDDNIIIDNLFCNSDSNSINIKIYN